MKMWRAANLRKQDYEDLFLLGVTYFMIKKNKSKRRFWSRPSLRQKGGNMASKLLQDLREDGISIGGELRSSFKNFLGMSSTDFENLLCLIGTIISKKNPNYRDYTSTGTFCHHTEVPSNRRFVP